MIILVMMLMMMMMTTTMMMVGDDDDDNDNTNDYHHYSRARASVHVFVRRTQDVCRARLISRGLPLVRISS